MNKNFRLILILVLTTLILVLASCSSIKSYEEPSEKIMQEALVGGTWPEDIPAPQFISKLDNKYYDTNYDSVVLEFYEVPRDEVESYAEKLEKSKFKVTGIVEYFEGNEDLAKKQAKDKYYDSYNVEKDDYFMNINIEAYNKNVVQIQISGLSQEEINTMNIQEDNIDYSSELILVEKYLKKDISNSIKNKKQNDNIPKPDFWKYDILVPAYIDKVSEYYPDIMGQTIVFNSITAEEFGSYLAALKDAGFKIEIGVIYTIIENAKANSSFYADNRNNEDRAKQEMDNEVYTIILASKANYTIKFDITFADNEDRLASSYGHLMITIIDMNNDVASNAEDVNEEESLPPEFENDPDAFNRPDFDFGYEEWPDYIPDEILELEGTINQIIFGQFHMRIFISDITNQDVEDYIIQMKKAGFKEQYIIYTKEGFADDFEARREKDEFDAVEFTKDDYVVKLEAGDGEAVLDIDTRNFPEDALREIQNQNNPQHIENTETTEIEQPQQDTRE